VAACPEDALSVDARSNNKKFNPHLDISKLIPNLFQ
jgi:hypothetical protein